MAPKMVMKAKQVMKAMKVMKAKKVMKSLTGMKATHAASAKGQEMNKLSEACLLKLQGASSQKIEGFLNGLNDKESMSLWKKYEKKRHVEGTQGDYEQAVAGAGKRDKSRQSLKVFIKTGSTKSAEHRSLMASLTNTTTHSYEQEWLSPNEALSKWGKRELQARVLAGTITCRNCPDDPRFPEFRAVKEKKEDKIIDRTSHTYESRGAADKQQMMDFFRCIKNNPGQKLDFQLEDSSEADQPLAVAKQFLNLKGQNPQFALQDGQLAVEDQTPEAYIEALETASALNDSAGAEKCASSLETAKTSLEQLVTQVESVQPQSGQGAKKFKDVVKKLKGHFQVIEKMSEKKHGKKGGKKGKKFTAGVVKKALKAAMKDCKSAQKLINS